MRFNIIPSFTCSVDAIKQQIDAVVLVEKHGGNALLDPLQSSLAFFHPKNKKTITFFKKTQKHTPRLAKKT